MQAIKYSEKYHASAIERMMLFNQKSLDKYIKTYK